MTKETFDDTINSAYNVVQGLCVVISALSDLLGSSEQQGTDVTKLKTDLSTLQTKVTQLETTLDTLSNKVDSDYDTLDSQVQDLQTDISNVQGSLTSLTSDLTTLKNTTISDIQNDIDNIQSHLTTIESDLDDFNGKLNTIQQSDIPDIRNEIGKINTHLNLVEGKIKPIVIHKVTCSSMGSNNSGGDPYIESSQWIFISNELSLYTNQNFVDILNSKTGIYAKCVSGVYNPVMSTIYGYVLYASGGKITIVWYNNEPSKVGTMIDITTKGFTNLGKITADEVYILQGES